MQIIPLERGFGAEVIGYDFDRDPTDTSKQALRDALRAHTFLWCKKGGKMTWQDQVRFSRALGDKLVTASNGKPMVQDLHYDTFRYWHSDVVSGKEPPPLFTVLHCLVTPPDQGDTLLLNNDEVARRLTPTLRERIARATILMLPPIGFFHHGGEKRDVLFYNLQSIILNPQDLSEPAPEPSWDELPAQRAEQIRLGMDLHVFLERLATDAEPGVFARIRWSEGDTVAWDNYRVAHSATPMKQGIRWLRRTLVGAPWTLRDLGFDDAALERAAKAFT
jgi:alpha-ketoglutarate-dependent taurine dioxygenase